MKIKVTAYFDKIFHKIGTIYWKNEKNAFRANCPLYVKCKFIPEGDVFIEF